LSLRAWLLEAASGGMVAIGEREMVHVLDDYRSWPVPLAPRGCDRLLLWQGRVLPVMNLAARLGREAGQGGARAGVVAWSGADGAIAFGALVLHSLPIAEELGEPRAATIEDVPAQWRAYSHSAFFRQDEVVPVLDLAALFAGGRQAREQAQGRPGT